MGDIGQVQNGELGKVVELCLPHAMKTFEERKSRDTNPRIVQMKAQGEPITPWYYRSDQWIDQPFMLFPLFIKPYIGKTLQAPPNLYGEGNYLEDPELMNDIRTLTED